MKIKSETKVTNRKSEEIYWARVEKMFEFIFGLMKVNKIDEEVANKALPKVFKKSTAEVLKNMLDQVRVEKVSLDIFEFVCAGVNVFKVLH